MSRAEMRMTRAGLGVTSHENFGVSRYMLGRDQYILGVTSTGWGVSSSVISMN